MLLPRLFALVSSTDDLCLLEGFADAGMTGFQVRDKDATTAELLELTRVVIAAVRPHGATVIVNDRVDVALAAGADGVHLGAGDLPVSAARRIAPDLVIGATCRSMADVERAAAAGATYAGFGPIFATSSKAGLPEPLGVEALTTATGRLPLIAIGGIDADSAPGVLAAGAHGVAVIGGLWRQPDPLVAAKELAAVG